MPKLTSLSAVEMRDGLQSRLFSCRELAEAHLARIEETNEQFNSFLTVANAAALDAADKADKIFASTGPAALPLAGIPISLKDNLVTKGIKTTAGSKILQQFIPPYECTAVSRLKDAGAVILGKTNLDEFGMGASTENSAFGVVKNPWDETRVPGGSSGGSAVSVALGQAALSLGTDTGGSVRQPAAFTGLIGLKPTYGRISRYGVIAFASSLDQIGILSRSIDDCAMLFDAIAGADPLDSTSVPENVPECLKQLQSSDLSSLRGLRIGVPKEYFISGMDLSVENAVKESITAFSKLGAEIVEISLPHTAYALGAYYIIAPAEASSNLARYDGVRYGFRASNIGSLAELYEQTRARGFGQEVQRRILIGTYVLSAGYYEAFYGKAQQVRTLIIDDFKAAFANHCDLIVTPTSPSTAFKIGERTGSSLQMYLADVFTTPTSLAGLPALNVPCGVDGAGLPIGLQLIGNAFDELRLLKTGAALLQARPFQTNKFTRDLK